MKQKRILPKLRQLDIWIVMTQALNRVKCLFVVATDLGQADWKKINWLIKVEQSSLVMFHVCLKELSTSSPEKCWKQPAVSNFWSYQLVEW